MSLAPAWMGPYSRWENAAMPVSTGFLDTQNGSATLLRPLTRVARKVLQPTRSAFRSTGYGLLVAHPPAPILENSTACVCDEKRCRVDPSGPPAGEDDIVYPSTSVRRSR